jgi:hypothetical protein
MKVQPMSDHSAPSCQMLSSKPAVTRRSFLDRAVLASVLATTVMSLTALAIELHAVPPLAAANSITLRALA